MTDHNIDELHRIVATGRKSDYVLAPQPRTWPSGDPQPLRNEEVPLLPPGMLLEDRVVDRRWVWVRYDDEISERMLLCILGPPDKPQIGMRVPADSVTGLQIIGAIPGSEAQRVLNRALA